MIRGKCFALGVLLGTAAISSASWTKMADVLTGDFVPGSSSSLVKAQLQFTPVFAATFGDQGQYFLDISTTSNLPAYDYTGITGTPGVPVATGQSYEWLLNNYQGSKVMNSHLLGTTVTQVGSTTELMSTGVWDWYYHNYGQTQVSDWGFTGKYRLADEGLTGKLSFEAEAVPEPFSLVLGVGAIGLAIKRRYRKA